MGYRVEVHPDARAVLQALAPHVVVRLGRALADLVEALTSGEEEASGELRIDECVMQYAVDHTSELLRVIGVETSTQAWGEAGA